MDPWNIVRRKIGGALFQSGLAISFLSSLAGCTRGNDIVVVTPETYQKQLRYYAQGDSPSSPSNMERRKQQTSRVIATDAQQGLNGSTIMSRPLTNRERKEQALLVGIPYEELDERDEQKAQFLYRLQDKQRHEKAAEEHRERLAMEAKQRQRQGPPAQGFNWWGGLAGGLNALGDAAMMNPGGYPSQGSYLSQGGDDDPTAPGRFHSATILSPGSPPSYYSGNNIGGTLITPGRPPSYINSFGNSTTIITPGKPPVYIYGDGF